MTAERRSDLGIAGATLALAAAIAATALTFPAGQQDGDPGAALLPLLLAAVLAVLGATRVLAPLVVRSAPPPPEADGGPEEEPGPVLPVLGMLAVGAVSVWAMSWVGFVLGAALLLVGGALLSGERRWSRIALLAVLVPPVVYALFMWAFELRLPTGPLEAVLL
ncbi:tripartite tricarboxylate transporter TctB family protein [Nocardiopsis sp. HNM0947]|uniref:Tripartite tricarboxylate transporter TctB family protein n=1 Tax=Nocardiopsis coralli TaxID=2772213 RepID=A0ABR9P6E8_9ACTN|nr:tripartite tricarboxylate transporter TctB family protein [Nocardiopsis coralli]MBE2999389.1 tripartite tricarboxylate transporter TctB family protein [Nocardiopsis coralli]